MDSQTQEPPADPTTGPRVSREQVRDFTRLRRSATDRYVGGVAGGVARHLDVDPTLVRVVLAVLALFGGAGLVVYAAIWLLVPEDGRDRAPLELGPDVAKVLVIVAVVVAGLVVLGVPWVDSGGFWFPWPLLLLALVVTWLVTRNRPASPPAAGPPAAGPGAPAATPAAAPAAPPAATGLPLAAPSAPSSGTPGTPTAPPAWGPPPPPLPPRPRRTGVVLFWPTLAVVAVALGVLGMVDVTTDVPVSAYAALALTVVGLALLLGAFRGRPGGLIALGLLTTLGLGVTSAVDAAQLSGTYSETTVAPTSVQQLQAGYAPDNGDFTLDLAGLDPDDLRGRDLDVEMGTGQLTVVLPRGVDADIASDIAVAGGVTIDGVQAGGGLGWSDDYRLVGDGSGAPVALDLALRLGGIRVTTA